MPNVMGREFPYTPEGMAAAEDYRSSMGMRGGGMMGFRPVGYQDGDLVESVGPALQQSFSNFAGAPVDAVNSALGAVGLDSTTPVGGAESISNVIDTVKTLVQQFAAQDVPDPVKAAVNAAIETFGMPVDLVNSALGALGIPVSETPIGGSKNLKEIAGFPTRWLSGMRGGGMLGFRPVGYQDGDLVDEELNIVEQLRNRFYELRELISAGASGAEEELIKLIKREEEGLRASKDPTINKIIDNYIGDISIPPGAPDQGDQRLSDRDLRDLQMAPSPEEYDPELNEMLKQLDKDRAEYDRLSKDPAWAGAEEERMAGQPLDPSSEWDRIREAERYPSILKGDIPMPPWMMDPRYKGYYNPEQLNPFFNPNEIEVADGGYITRKMNRGGLMSLARRRGYAG